MKTKLIISLFALCACVLQAADITVENYSFELPGTAKIKGWNGENGTDIPGWASDTSATDSGVESATSSDGSWRAYLRGSDSSIYNLTTHVIAACEVYTLQVDARSAGSIISLYYDDNGTRVTMGSVTNASTSSYTTYSLTVSAGDFSDAAGHYLGVEIDNSSTSSSSWLATDNVRVSYTITETATSPSPSHNTVNVALTTATLSWCTAIDPANPTSVNPNVTKHYVYFAKKGANSYGDPNFPSSPIEVIADGSATAGCTIPFALESNAIYYWRVDESINNSGPSDAATIVGSVWSFATKHAPKTIIYKETFGGSSTGQLNGLIPDIAPTGTAWTAPSNYTASGVATYTGSAFLPFVPQDGWIYTLSINVDVTQNTSGRTYDWFALGFSSGNSTPTSRFIDGNTGLYWLLIRTSSASSSYYDQTFASTGTSSSQDIKVSTSGFNSYSADDLKIILDTTGTSWVVKWYTDGQLARTATVTDSHKAYFQYVAVSTYQSDAKMSNFSLEGLHVVEAANTPTPADEAVDIEISSALSWTVGADPADTSIVNAEITKHYVYMLETERDFVGDPNFLPVTPYTVTADGNATASCAAPITLHTDKAYYWRVDECFNDAQPTDANNVLPGQVWKFMTVQSIPVITTQPTGVTTTPGSDAQLSIVVESASTPTYNWYKTTDAVTTTSADDTLITDADGLPATLTLSAVTGTGEGYYYCAISNASGVTVYSDVVIVQVYRQVACWPLDYLTAGQYADTSADSHNATPVGTPTFVTGAGASTANGVQVDASNGFADAGTWNPIDYTGQLTLSLWAKWDGQIQYAETWQGLLAKRNSLAADAMMWQLAIGSEDNKIFFKNASYSLAADVMPTGEWVNIAVTYDGTTATIYINGVAKASKTMSLNTGTAANIVIGAVEKTDSGVFNNPFKGALDEVQLYNYAFDTHQIADLYYTVSGKQMCLDAYADTYDLNDDCKVDLDDLLLLLPDWLEDGYYPNN